MPNTALRVLVLHQHYWPEIAATAQILTDLCEDLAAAGHHVTVVCGHPSYRSANQAPVAAHETRNGVDIVRVWSYLPKERTIPQRVMHYGSYFSTSLWSALTATKPDVCIVMSTPPLLLGVSGALLKMLRNVPFVYSVQDLYPDIAVHLGVVRENGAVARISNVVANQCYGRAAQLIALSEGMQQRLVAKGIDPTRISVIPNWADTASLLPQARDNAFARAHGLNGTFVVQYAGNLGLSQGLEHVIEAAEQLKDQDITFALIGDGNARPMLELAAKTKRLDRVKFIRPQPRAELGHVLSACDVGLVTMRVGVGNDLVPSKLYGIMAASRPVLAAVESDTEVARVVNKYRCGWVVRAESADALAEGILAARACAERTEMGGRGRVACRSEYSRETCTKRYGQALLDVARVPPSPMVGGPRSDYGAARRKPESAEHPLK